MLKLLRFTHTHHAEPLLIDEDYYARVEGREIISNLAKAAGLATMIATMRPDIDNPDEVRSHCTVLPCDCILLFRPRLVGLLALRREMHLRFFFFFFFFSSLSERGERQ